MSRYAHSPALETGKYRFCEADQSRRPQTLLAHRQLAFAQIAPREPRQSLQVAGIPQIDQPEIDLGVIPDFQRHAADRTPKHAAACIFHGVGGSLGHHGQSARAIRVFDSMRSQGLDESDEACGKFFARGVCGIGAAEKVNGLQVRHVRPLVDRSQRGACPISTGDHVYRSRAVDQGHPVGSSALRALPTPTSGPEAPRRRAAFDGFLRRLQQGRTPPRPHGLPARTRFDRTPLVVSDQGEAAGHRQPAGQFPSLWPREARRRRRAARTISAAERRSKPASGSRFADGSTLAKRSAAS